MKLRRSWERTEGFLRDARSHIPEAAEGICSDEITAFTDYLEHNELELALDVLDAAIQKRPSDNLRIIELMAMAAASMKLVDKQKEYDLQLSKARGWEYHTKLK